MITHEEALKTKRRIVRVADDGVGMQYSMYGVNYSATDAKNDCELLDKYIAQQEKVGELLELYRKHINNLCEIHRVGVKNSMHSSEFVAYELYEQIKQLEKELRL